MILYTYIPVTPLNLLTTYNFALWCMQLLYNLKISLIYFHWILYVELIERSLITSKTEKFGFHSSLPFTNNSVSESKSGAQTMFKIGPVKNRVYAIDFGLNNSFMSRMTSVGSTRNVTAFEVSSASVALLICYIWPGKLFSFFDLITLYSWVLLEDFYLVFLLTGELAA